jgi:TonB-linked SusC/RagA family outer membrane protein
LSWLLKGLKLRGAISYKNYYEEVKTFQKEKVTYDAQPTEDGEIVFVPNGEPSPVRTGSSANRNRRIYLEGGIEYNNKFNGHSVGALLLYNQSKYHSPDLAFLIPNGYQGAVGRVTYDYMGRYLAEFDIGYNGTENFAEGHRFGWFPSFSLGWVPTDEPFFPKNDVLTFLKIRASYGVVGNDKVGSDRFLYVPTSYTFSNNVYNFGEVATNYQSYRGAYEGKIGNPSLTWEKAKKLNIGIDSHFLKDKISLTLEWFLERRDNILTNRGTIPVIIGANMPAYNLGRMRNSGYEGEIAYNDRWGDFRFFAKGNFTYAHNKILEQDEMHWPWAYQFRTGNRYGQFFGYVADGLFNTWEEVNDVNRPIYQWNDNKLQPGDIKYKDVNGDGYINDQDIVPIGYSNFPEIMFGLSFGGSWKGIDVSVLFQGATNVSTQPSRRTMRGFYTGTGASKDLLKSWSYERYSAGEEIVYPRYSVTNDTHNYVTSTYWIEDATYVRLKSAEVGYTVTTNWLSKAGISSVRLYFNGNNLLTFCDLFPGEDPEYPTMEANSEPYPLSRVFNFGLNINF